MSDLLNTLGIFFKGVALATMGLGATFGMLVIFILLWPGPRTRFGWKTELAEGLLPYINHWLFWMLASAAAICFVFFGFFGLPTWAKHFLKSALAVVFFPYVVAGWLEDKFRDAK